MIKIQTRTNKEINRVIKNFDQKISRLERLDKQTAIPDKISKKELMNVNSRSELNRKLNQLKRFSRRGSEDLITLESGEMITSWERRETGIEIRVAQAKLTRKIKKLESSKPKVAGKVQAVTFAEMGDTQYTNLKTRKERLKQMKLDSLSNIKKFRKVAQKILKIGFGSVFRDSYKTMFNDIVELYDYDEEKASKIIENMDKLKDNDFLKLFNEDKAIKSIIYYYPDKNGNNILNIEDIKDDVKNLFDEVYNNIDTILEDYN